MLQFLLYFKEFSMKVVYFVGAFILLGIILSFYYKKIAAKYAASIDKEIDSKNSEKLMEIFNEIVQKYKSNDLVKIAFENTYYHFLNQAFFSDFPNKKELLLFYEKNMKGATLASHKKNFIDRVLDTLSDIEHPTEDDFNYFNEILLDLKVDADTQNDANKRLSIIKKIADLRKNGLQPLEIHNPITAKKDCFYYGNIDILKNRQKNGQKFFEYDKTGEIYILNDEIDIVVDGGHKKIKLSNIISLDFEDEILQLTILNRSTPLGLSSKEPEYVLEILNMVRKLS